MKYKFNTNTLRFKFIVFVLFIISMIMVVIFGLIMFVSMRLSSLETVQGTHIEQAIMKEWQQKIYAWGHNMQANIDSSFQQYDLLPFKQYITAMMQEKEINYIYLMDVKGRVLIAESRDSDNAPKLGEEILSPTLLKTSDETSIHIGDVSKITIPLFNQAGIQLGFIQYAVSHHGVHELIAQLLKKFHASIENLGAAFFIGISLLFLLSGVLISIGTYQLIKRHILKPIDDLKLGIQYVSDANLYYRIFIHATDEFNALAHSFNVMTDNLQNTLFSKSYVDDIFYSVQNSLIVTTMEGAILKVNNATSEILGYKQTDLLGKSIDMIFPKKQDGDIFASLKQKLMQRGEIRAIEAEYLTKSGNIIPVLFSGKIMYNEAKESEGIVWSAQDVTKQKDAESKLEHLAKFDTLTNIPNRFFFNEYLKLAIGRTQRTNKKLALLYMDLDYFKQVNDTLGHDMGDVLLKEVPKRIKENIRAIDFVARLGGDEFVIIIEDLSDIQAVSKVADKIIRIVSEKYLLKGHEAHVSASIGIACYPCDSDDADTLIKHADMALYSAKEAGRGCHKFYDDSM